jgi:hypothetical protein
MAVEARCFGVTKLAAATFCIYVGKSLMKPPFMLLLMCGRKSDLSPHERKRPKI